MPRSTERLTPKQRRLVEEFMVDYDKTAAARRAGYTENTALRQQPFHAIAVQREIQRLLEAKTRETAERASQQQMTPERTLDELRRLALFDVRKLFRPDGSPIPVNELDDDIASIIVGLEVLEQYEGNGDDRRFVGYVKKYKLADKLGAITTAMRHMGMLNTRLELTGKNGGPLAITGIGTQLGLQEKTDEQLKALEAHYRTMLGLADDERRAVH